MTITTEIMSSNPAHGEVYSIQHYVIKFVSEMQQLGGFLWFSSTNKTDRHNITEILWKVALNTITLTPENIDFDEEISNKSTKVLIDCLREEG